MIVKASHSLRSAIFKVPNAPIAPNPDLSHLLPIMPDWLKQLLINGSVLVLDPEDYYCLPMEISEQLEVLNR